MDAKKEEISNREKEMAVREFWDDKKKAEKVIAETNRLKQYVNQLDELDKQMDNLFVSYELVKEENDHELFEEMEKETSILQEKINQFELQMLLSDPYDANNAILELHPCAGGTESQDWASILLRM